MSDREGSNDPDNYPLSLNALTSACNQLSNREPVMSLGDLIVYNGSTRNFTLVKTPT